MNTPTNAYITKLSSGTILTLLALSGILFAAPLVTPVHASVANNPILHIWPGALQNENGEWTPMRINFTNPASNTVGITKFIIQAPIGFDYIHNTAGLPDQYCNADPVNAYFDDCHQGGTQAVFNTNGTGTAVPPGITTFITCCDQNSIPSVSGTYTFQTSWYDTDGAAHAGPSIVVTLFDNGNTLNANGLTAASGTFTAGGSPYTLTANTGLSASGLVITWGTDTALGSFSGSGLNCVHAYLCWGLTGSDGKDTVTFTPDNTAGTTTVFATLGANAPFCPATSSGQEIAPGSTAFSTTGQCNSEWFADATFAVTTIAGPPSSVAWTRSAASDGTGGTAFGSSKHITLSEGGYFGTGNYTGATTMGEIAIGSGASYFAVHVSDAFMNPISFGDITAPSITISAPSGDGWSHNGASLYSTISCAAIGAAHPVHCASGTITLNYFQSYTWGTTVALTAVISGTYTPTGTPFSVSATSGQIITGTEATSVALANSGGALTVGTVQTFTATLGGGSLQPGVPVTFEVCTPTGCPAVSVYGSFTTGGQSATVATGSAGTATAKYTLSTKAGITEHFNATIPDTPVLTGATGVYTSGDVVVGPTVAGAASSLKTSAYFSPPYVNKVGGSLVAGQTLHVVISLVDQYGNAAAATGNQIQITLSASAGVLSATNVYIASTSPDTFTPPSFGDIQWTVPSSVAIGTVVTLTATGVVAGNQVSSTKTVTIVSPIPTLAVSTTPAASANGWVYSNTGAVTFNGTANVSPGYSPTVVISTIGYKVNSNPWATGATPGTNMATFSFSLFFPSGVSTVILNATDSKTNSVLSPTFSILVDTSAPVITATTAAGASLSNGQPVVFSVVDGMGDLDFSSVTANYNGTAVASSSISISGANNPGHSVTYTVSVSGIPLGHWKVTLNAKDLAGNTAAPASVTVFVTSSVPFAQSFVIQGSPSYTTIGGYNGISATYTNEGSASQSVVVFAIWKNSLSQTVAVTAGSMTLAAGATGSAFAPLVTGLPSGTYTVNVFVFTTSNLPVSSTTTITVTV